VDVGRDDFLMRNVSYEASYSECSNHSTLGPHNCKGLRLHRISCPSPSEGRKGDKGVRTGEFLVRPGLLFTFIYSF